jgi:hypothetical protein
LLKLRASNMSFGNLRISIIEVNFSQILWLTYESGEKENEESWVRDRG